MVYYVFIQFKFDKCLKVGVGGGVAGGDVLCGPEIDIACAGFDSKEGLAKVLACSSSAASLLPALEAVSAGWTFQELGTWGERPGLGEVCRKMLFRRCSL